VMLSASAFGQSTFPPLLSDSPAHEHQDKLMLFGQLVGSWNFTGIEYHDDGTRSTDKGDIHFHWILGGNAIQDVWQETERSDTDEKVYGTTVRFYDPKNDFWRVTWIDPGRAVVRTFIGRRIGRDIVIEGRSENGMLIHWIFSDIQQRAFHWRAERLNGKKWRVYEELWARRI
jgi:hypothetical protein